MDKFMNEAAWDRIARIVLGLVMLGIGFGGVIPGGWRIAVGLLGFVPLLTGIVGICPLYFILKIRTLAKRL